MAVKWLFGELPQCPVALVDKLSFPSLFFTFGITAIVSFIFLCIVGFKYNSVKVFEHRIRTPGISNTLWIVFFLFIFLRSTVESVRFAVKGLNTANDAWFMAVAFSLHAFATLALCLALNHQRRFRSAAILEDDDSSIPSAEETDPLMRRMSKMKKTISAPEIFFIVLFVIQVAMAWLTIVEFHGNIESDGEPYKWIFLGSFVVQRLPAIVLAVFIISQPTQRGGADSVISGDALSADDSILGTNDGPSLKAKVFLGIATGLTIFGDIPLAVWALFIPSNCVLYIFAGVDIVHIVYVVGLIFYFLFLRCEYLRNMEETIWDTVNRFSSAFQFRKF